MTLHQRVNILGAGLLVAGLLLILAGYLIIHSATSSPRIDTNATAYTTGPPSGGLTPCVSLSGLKGYTVGGDCIP